MGEFGIRNPGPSADLSDKSFAEVLAKVRQQGGIGFAAHVTSDNGLFEVLSGQARIKAWKCEDLLAIQIPGSVDELHASVRSIVTNQDPSYRRRHPADSGLAVAAVNAEDVVDPADLEKRSSTCRIKMSSIGIEGLRQASLDPGSRIRLNPKAGEPEAAGHAEMLAVEWTGGFLNGEKVDLNPNLNVLVGGRGAGKSTVVESLRYVLDLEPVGADAAKAHQGIVRNVLRAGTKVSLDVRSHHPTPREYRIERTVPNPPIVRDDQGNIKDLLPADVIPDVEVYGQHEISELTGKPERLTRLLDRFVERDPALAGRKAALRREMRTTRRSLVEAAQELERITDDLAVLPGLEESLGRFREAGVEERLQERSLLVREERLLDTVVERLASVRRRLEDLRQEIPIDRNFLSPRALAELPGKAIVAQASEVLKSLSNEAADMLEGFDRALTRADQEIAEVDARWRERERQVIDDYERILRDLQGLPVQADGFVEVRTQIERLRPLGERRTRLTRSREQHLRERRAQVAEAADFSLPEFVEICRVGADALQERYGIPQMQASRLAEASDETLALVEELDLPPTMAIRLNTAPAGEPPRWQELEDLSTGQKATAVLLLLLIDSDAPLVIDQPEDDLDNRFVTEGVVPRMRRAKQRRQFIFPRWPISAATRSSRRSRPFSRGRETQRPDATFWQFRSLPARTNRTHALHHGSKKYYIRVGDTSREASREELEPMFQASRRLNYGLKPVPGAGLDAFDRRRVRDYFERVRGGALPEDHDLEGWETVLTNTELMTAAAGHRTATIDGILLFGREPERYLFQSGIRAVCHPGTEPEYPVRADADLRGPMVPLGPPGPDMRQRGLVEKAWDFVRLNTRPRARLEGGRRVSGWEYPEAVVREAVTSALVHRDYSIAGTDIMLAIYSDRLEIVTPGRLPNTVTVEGMRTGVRYARNQNLFNVMRDYGYVEALGMGVSRKIIPGMRAHNGTEPELMPEPHRFTVRLWRRGPDGR